MTLPQFASYETARQWGSSVEARVFYELRRRGMRPGVDFLYQFEVFGGRQERGGFVVDFRILNPPGLMFSVVGAYWHLKNSADVVALRLFRNQMAALNYTVIFLTEEQVIEDVRFYVGEALAGIDHSGL